MVPDFQQVALAAHSRNCWMLSSLGNVVTALGVWMGTSGTLWEIWTFCLFVCFYSWSIRNWSRRFLYAGLLQVVGLHCQMGISAALVLHWGLCKSSGLHRKRSSDPVSSFKGLRVFVKENLAPQFHYQRWQIIR